MYTTLEQIAEDVKKCAKCPLAKMRTNAVPGEGNPQADIMFVGEGPGQHEDMQGRPFVGAAGKFLEEMLGVIGLKREDVYITNIVKCRPPGNRDPEEVEVETCCTSYLNFQIAIMKPKLIVTLGRHSLKWFLKEEIPISKVHGQLKLITNKKTGEAQHILPLYHPAAALYSGSQRPVHIEDFKKIPGIVEKIKSGALGSGSAPGSSSALPGTPATPPQMRLGF